MARLATVTSAVAGLLMGVAYVLGAGLISLQVSGRRDGVIYDLDNEVSRVVGAHLPVGVMGLGAALTGLMLLFLLRGTRTLARASRILFVASFMLSTLAVIVIGLLITVGVWGESTLLVGVAPGWKGWAAAGSVNPAVHAVLLVALGTWWSVTRKKRRHQ